MEQEKFEELVAEAVESLPKGIRLKLENVDIVVEDYPTSGQVNPRYKKSVLGLYQGIPLLERNHQYGMVLPDKISIFKKNIEQISQNEQEIKKIVAHTVRHELAHHFGFSDQELREMGKY